MIEALKAAAVSGLVSAVITGIGVYYLHSYLDAKREEGETRATQRRRERRQMDILEQRRRRAEGRLLFWLHDAVVKGVPHANGDLQRAQEAFDEAEEAQKAYEQELLAEHADQNREGR